MVRRSGGADFSASRDLTADSVMNDSLTGASVTSLAFFCHGINALPAVYPDTTPTCPFLHAMYLAQLQLADPCLQAKLREGSQSSTGNYAELHCNHHARKRVFGGAWCPSSQVRLSSLTYRLPSHAADLALSVRVEGPFS